MSTHHDVQEIWLTGQARSPSDWQKVKAGPLESSLDGPDLRGISYRGVEVIQQLYVAIRDPDWNTIAGSVDAFELVESPGNRFAATFRSVHAHSGMDFEWLGAIHGSGDGTLEYKLEGLTRFGYSYSRIGFSVLFGIAPYRGRPYRAELDGTMIEGRLPDVVGPQAVVNGRETGLFPPFRHLELSPLDDVWVTLDFIGDDFEMEDQRNFGDGSYKAYSTPLQRPGPFSLAPGEHFQQSVRISVSDGRAKGRSAVVPRDHDVIVRASSDHRIPAIGLAYAADAGPLTANQAERLTALRSDHIRLELDASDGVRRAADRLEGAASDARRLGCDLWVEIRNAAVARPVLDRYVTLAMATKPRPRYLLLRGPSMAPLDRDKTGEALATARDVAERPGSGGTVGIASDFLADLICLSFDEAVVRVVSFGLCPTVHRSDDATLMENLAGIESEVAAARTAIGNGRLFVGPITLATRHGPYPGGPQPADGLPASVDHRQASLLAAAWTLGCLAALSRTDADALTFYETSGWRGVMAAGSDLAFPAREVLSPGSVYPLWHVLADAAELRGCRLRWLDIGPPGVVGLAAGTADGIVLLLASVWRTTERLSIRGIPATEVRVRTLDSQSAHFATHEPDAFRRSGDRIHVSDGGVPLTLGPYAVVRIDADV